MPRRALVRALAKINLTLEVLNRRDDGFHNLRTVFQTISLGDTIAIEYEPGRARRRIELASAMDIPNNLVVRAAEAIAEATNARGTFRFELRKRIPMGGGLGGGSTDAAAVLLAVPALTGRPAEPGTLLRIAAELGSDVPFFLTGGTAAATGRGTDFYPLADARPSPLLLATPNVHVSTAEAYSSLGRSLTYTPESHKMNFPSLLLALGGNVCPGEWARFCVNDFEPAVFARHPELAAIQRRLRRAGADPARMTGSGAAMFGVFESAGHRQRARQFLGKEAFLPVSFVGRSRYRALWAKQLAEHIQPGTWPPRSRYAR